MDPRATLNAADQAVSEGDYEAARENLDAYRAWRTRGGFQPDMGWVPLTMGDAFADEVERRLGDHLEFAVEALKFGLD